MAIQAVQDSLTGLHIRLWKRPINFVIAEKSDSLKNRIINLRLIYICAIFYITLAMKRSFNTIILWFSAKDFR